MKNRWKPTGSLETLKKRAFFISEIRKFFNQSDALEVETPILSAFANTDINIDSFSSQGINSETNRSFLRTSPEFPLKRLLCAGFGDVFEIGKVFRRGEVGSQHNSEFTMLEWYRVNFDFYQLMNEIAELFNHVNSLFNKPFLQPEHLQFDECFSKYLGVELQTIDVAELNQLCQINGYDGETLSFEQSLDFLFATQIQPQLGQNNLQFVTHYPASQAALAQIDPKDSSKSLRFEFFIDGVEFGNGYQEITDAIELRARFESDNQFRQSNSHKDYEFKLPIDELLLEAMTYGMPNCSGVAVGLDRWLMYLLGLKRIEEVLTFNSNNA